MNALLNWIDFAIKRSFIAFSLYFILAGHLTSCQRTQQLEPVQRDANGKDSNSGGDALKPDSSASPQNPIGPTLPPGPAPVVSPPAPSLNPSILNWDGSSDFSSDPKIVIRSL